MKIKTIVAVGALFCGLAAQERQVAPVRPQRVDVGAQPEYSFQKPLYNGRGIRSLADLRGKPAIIEFWGTR